MTKALKLCNLFSRVSQLHTPQASSLIDMEVWTNSVLLHCDKLHHSSGMNSVINKHDFLLRLRKETLLYIFLEKHDRQIYMLKFRIMIEIKSCYCEKWL